MTEKLVNATDKPVKFKIATTPGVEPMRFDVKPGETCEVPAGYVESGHIFRIAPGLARVGDVPAKVANDVVASTAKPVSPAAADTEPPPPAPAPPKRRRRKKA